MEMRSRKLLLSFMVNALCDIFISASLRVPCHVFVQGGGWWVAGSHIN